MLLCSDSFQRMKGSYQVIVNLDESAIFEKLREGKTFNFKVPCHFQPRRQCSRKLDFIRCLGNINFGGDRYFMQKGKHKPDVCCQNLVLLVEPHNLLEAEKSIDFLKTIKRSGSGLQTHEELTHEMVNLRGTESSPFITGRSMEL